LRYWTWNPASQTGSEEGLTVAVVVAAVEVVEGSLELLEVITADDDEIELAEAEDEPELKMADDEAAADDEEAALVELDVLAVLDEL